MEYKITNFDVTTENTKLEQTAELPIDADISLADYEPDIKKILKCEIKPYISSKRISGNALGVEGTAIVCVIYADSDGVVFSTEREVPFKKLFEANCMLDGGSCEAYITSNAYSCRAVTERKLSVKGSVKIDALVFVSQNKQIISDIDSKCFETLCGEAEATTPMGTAEKSFVIDEELTLNDKMPSAAKIIRSSATPTIIECKIINNKVIVKGNLNITAFYCTTDGNVCDYKTAIPFSQIVDFIGIGEGCECDARITVCSLNLSTRTSQSGECRSFTLVCKLLITAMARCESNVPVIFDVYSTRYEIAPKKEEVCFNKIIHQSSEAFSCKKTLSLPESSASRVLGLWCLNSSCMPRFDENDMRLCGTITVCIIAADENDEPAYFERIIDYEYPIQISVPLNQPKCHPNAEILNVEHTVSSLGEIELQLQLQLSTTVYDIKTVSLITELEIDENKTVNSDNATIIAYFAEANENVWEICKSFLADRKELMEINDIKEEMISSPRMLLIPKF